MSFTRADKRFIDDMNRPVQDALIALYMGYFSSPHYHMLATAAAVGFHLTAETPRHRERAPIFNVCFRTMSAIFERGDWSVTPNEVTDIDNAMKLLRGLLQTVPLKKIQKCVRLATNSLNEQ